MIAAIRAFPLLITVCALAGPTGAETVTTGSLVEEMVDLHRLAHFPSPAFETVQFSSYDHRAEIPGAPGWFANGDGFGLSRVSRYSDAHGVARSICRVGACDANDLAPGHVLAPQFQRQSVATGL